MSDRNYLAVDVSMGYPAGETIRLVTQLIPKKQDRI
jgi:hypothetical protein